MTLYPEQNFGSFFEVSTPRHLALPVGTGSTSASSRVLGRHLFTFGYSFSRSAYGGTVGNLPVSVLREDQTLATEITYSSQLPSSAAENNYVFFAQDNWQIHPRSHNDVKKTQ